MKKMKKLTAALLALAMALGLAACNPSGSTPSGAPENSGTPEQSAPPAVQSADLEELGSGDVKWKEETTADGWVKITNEGGAALGYSKDSGVALLQSGGFAFKDLNRNGALDPYEDWRLDYETRARDLASQMSGEQIAPYLTHGGWGTFTTDKNVFTSADNAGYAYITGGGRGGVTRNMGSSTEDNVNHAIWINLIQELCESLDFGIPAVVSIDPNGQSGIAQQNTLAAIMDPDVALEVGKEYSKQYRAAGVHMLLGPQIDLMTSPVMDRGTSTYGEDPALDRDITEAFVSGMQSTWDGSTDLGWGADSVVAVMKHYAGAGASEGGRDDHSPMGKYAVFPNNNYEAHLIAFHDGAFNLSHSSTKAAAGIMTNYSVSYSPDKSLGEYVGGGFSQFKFDTLFGSGWEGFIVSDWGIFPDGGRGGWGMEDYTVPERLANSISLGLTQAGGYNNLDDLAEAWEIIKSDLGEADALKMFQDRAYENILMTMRLGLFENPYNSTAHVRETNCTDETRAYGVETQMDSIVMVKNSNGAIKKSEGGDKQTVYIPYVYNYPSVSGWRRTPTASSWAPSVDLEVAAQYYNVVTDTLKDPSGPADEEGKATYTENDIVRASAADIAACDLILVGMKAPKLASYSETDETSGETTWYPANIQYNEYTAATAKETSVAGDQITETFNDGYTQQTKVTTENRSYKGNTAGRPGTYGHLEALQYAKNAAAGKPVVVLMTMANTTCMVFSEVEPLADAILVGYADVKAEAYLRTVTGEHEPNGLLVAQMPASMEAVEAQADDLPRDMECYVDADGNVYDFAFGLNWSGKIDDQRVKTYSAEPLTECATIDFKYANQ